MKFLLLIAFIVYILSPVDLIPDYFGPLGRLDDLGLVLFAWYHLRNKKAATADDEKTQTQQATRGTGQPASEQQRSTPSPQEILGVADTASLEEIEKAYRSLASQYHPDKVEHLGPELRAVAHEKMIQLTAAYKILSDKR